MKHLKLLPLLIAAVYAMPRAHAAQADATSETSGLYALLLGLALLLLLNLPSRSQTFRQDKDE